MSEFIRELNDIKKQADELVTKLELLKKAIDEKIAETKANLIAEILNIGGIDKEALKAFLEEPYVVIPKRKEEWYVIAPKFIPFSLGWLERSTKSYNIFIINKYVKWFAQIPKELERKLFGEEKPPEYKVVDGWLVTGPGKVKEAWKKYREYLSFKKEDRIRIKRGYEFQLISELVRSGILPFTPQPVDERDLREPPYMTFKLRDYQEQAWKTFLQYGAVGVYFPFGCFDEKTEILTESGWKKWFELTYDDKIATLNPHTFELEYQHPERIIYYWYDGKMFYLQTRQVSLLVTPDHNLFVAKPNKNGEKVWRICKPREIFNKKCYFKKNATWKGTKKKYFILPEIEIDRKKYKYKKPAKKIPMEEWLKFYGLWLADGYTCVDRKGNYQVGIRNMNPTLLKEMKDLLTKWGFNAKIYKGGRVRVIDKQLYAYLKKFGKAKTKFIDPEIKSLSPDLLNILLDYYLKGDGCGKKDILQAKTVSKRLVDDLQEIALKCGISANYAIERKSGEKGLTKRDGEWVKAPLPTTLYRITFVRRQNEPHLNPYRVEMDRAKWVSYSGVVWDVTVPNHIIYVRRNGKPYWSGNSGKTMIGLWAIAHLKGEKLVVVPTRTLVEQWIERIEKYIPWCRHEVEIVTYHAFDKVKGKKYVLTIYDECHRLPADTFIRLATIKTKYRLGLSGSPYREDGRTDLIIALTGYPVGLEWRKFFELGIIKQPVITLYVVKDLREKLKKLDELLMDRKKTIVFCDSIDLGKRISEKYDIPFVYGETRKRMDVLREHEVVVASRVADEGVSLPEIERVIEVDFLYGSRRQEAQRLGRLFHSAGSPEHYILMTEEELERYEKRLYAIYEKGFRINIVR